MFRQLTEEVLGATGGLSLVTWADVQALKGRALATRRRRARILLHGSPDALQHEMLIVMGQGQYSPPHRNDGAAKSYVVLDGALVLVQFDDDGAVCDHHLLEAGQTQRPFMARLEHSVWHTCLFVTDLVVYIESTLGPHIGTQYARWAPAAGSEAAATYLASLNRVAGVSEQTGSMVRSLPRATDSD